MALGTYTELRAAVLDWSNKPDLASFVPDFITLAERRIWAQLRSKALVKSLAIGYAIAATSVTTPADLISILSLVDTSTARSGVVTIVSQGRFAELQADTTLQNTGVTQMLSTGRVLLFVAAPTLAGTISGKYLAREPALSASVATNAVLEAYPDLYLFGTLMELADYMKDDMALGKYRARFELAMQDANMQSDYLGRERYISPRMTVV